VENTVKMKRFSTLLFSLISVVLFSIPQSCFSQACTGLTATYVTTESRCAATGKVQINVTGGSGSYQYKVNGPVNTNYTSVNLITGLSVGRYLVTVKDIVNNCIYDNDTITINGNYLTPGFTLNARAVSCIDGNDGRITVGSQSNGRAPFTYRIIAPSASSVGTVNTTGVFTGLISGNYLIQLWDSCGAIQTRNITVENYNWSINNYIISKFGCDSISVVLNLIDIKGNVTPDAKFNAFTYGASVTPGDTTWFTTNTFRYYKGKKRTAKIFVKDGCGNIKSVIWTDTAIPFVNAAVTISNNACSTFTASITGQVNLTSPAYCVYNSSNVLVSCNTTGVFNGLPYGNYCIRVTDVCYDTTINRCFTVAKPVPSVDINVNIATTCSSFTATITGKVNISDSTYCLYDVNNTLINCNATGRFINLPFGQYCIRVFNRTACYDTTIVRCFNVRRPVPSVGRNVSTTNLTCSTFTARITDTANLSNPRFCLYTSARVLIECNTTGVFNNLPYGTYCLDVVNDPLCYDTTITFCFTVNRPRPSVAPSVQISNVSCTDFWVTVTGQTNINNPRYCLYNSLNVQIDCNKTGVFKNIAFGSYCIDIKNDVDCYDTTIRRCFTYAATPVDIFLTTRKSCTTIGASEISVFLFSGTPRYSLELFSPTGALIQTGSTNSGSSYTFLNVPNLASPLRYKVVVTDKCGNKDSATIVPDASVVNRAIVVTPKCPSGTWANGSGDVSVNITNNIGGSIVPKIIRRDGAVVSINATSFSGYNYTFLNLAPATYVFDTYITDCNKHLYDTVTVRIYLYPILSGSNAFQCDNSGFSVSVNAQGGVAPYNYEVIGSTPSLPVINTAPQASPVFSVNNGTAYSLIRLRAIDGCGNASLYDVSVLPLANFIVTPNSAECFNNSLTLRVDSIANTVYTWYKRTVPNDSMVVGTGPSLNIPNLLPSDTGRYFCRAVVNNGCLIKIANYIVRGQCYVILPNAITLSGTKLADGNRLNWPADDVNVKNYSLEKSSGSNAGFQTINTVTGNGAKSHFFIDKQPFNGDNYYRLKVTGSNNSVEYTNVVLIKNTKFDISFYPNPVNSMLYISIESKATKNYAIEINNMLGQRIMVKTFYKIQNAVINYPRDKAIIPGVYTATITDLDTNEKQTYKLIYR
jgi:hypothetical protein